MESLNFSPVLKVKRNHFTCLKCNSAVVGLEQFKIHVKMHEQLPKAPDVDAGVDSPETSAQQEDTQQNIEEAALENDTALPGTSSTVGRRAIEPTDNRYACFLCGVRRVNRAMFKKHMSDAHKGRYPELVKGLIKLIPAMRRERMECNRELQRERDQYNL